MRLAKTLFVTCFFVGGCVFTLGCSQPEVQAIDLNMDQVAAIVKNYSQKGFQANLNTAASKMEAATTAEQRDEILKDLVLECEENAFLLVQAERANTLLLLARTLIKSDRSYIELLIEEFREAKATVDAGGDEGGGPG
jgi:hypothetical protein